MVSNSYAEMRKSIVLESHLTSERLLLEKQAACIIMKVNMTIQPYKKRRQTNYVIVNVANPYINTKHVLMVPFHDLYGLSFSLT